MKQIYKYALWLLFLIGILVTVLAGNLTLPMIGFQAFMLMILIVYGIRHFIVDDYHLHRAMIIILIVEFVSVVAIFITMRFIITNTNSFGVAIIYNILLALLLASILFYIMYYFLRSLFISEKQILYKEMLLLILTMIYIGTHLLNVPNNAEIPPTTYLLSIFGVGGIMGIIHFCLYKLFKISSSTILFAYVLLLIVVQVSTFDIQLVFLYPLQLWIFGLLVYKVYYVREQTVYLGHSLDS